MREYFIWLAKLITILILVFIAIPLLIGIGAAMLQIAGTDLSPAQGKSVAVVKLEGEIFDSQEVLKELYRQADNKKVKGTVLRINSPGGAVGPSQEIYEAVKELNRKDSKKPVVISMGALAASGGFYSALGGVKIFAEPGTLTGSIGVVLQVPNLRRLADWAGVSMITIKSGELKDVGNMFRDMTDSERQFLQQTIQRVQSDFVKAVSESRGIPLEEVLKFADGRVITGSEAKDLKLIDGFGNTYDAARAVLEIAGEPLKEGEIPTLIYPQDKLSEFKKVFEDSMSFLKPLSGGVQFKYIMY